MKTFCIALVALALASLTLNAQVCTPPAGAYRVLFNGNGVVTGQPYYLTGKIIIATVTNPFTFLTSTQVGGGIYLFRSLHGVANDGGEWDAGVGPDKKQNVTGSVAQNPFPDCGVILTLQDAMPFTNDGTLGGGVTLYLDSSADGKTLSGGGKATQLPFGTEQVIFQGLLAQ